MKIGCSGSVRLGSMAALAALFQFQSESMFCAPEFILI